MGRRGTFRGHTCLFRLTGRGVCRAENGQQRPAEARGISALSREECAWVRQSPSAPGLVGDGAVICGVSTEAFVYRGRLGTLECVDI